MKRLWLCLGVSLLCHALFFPGFLQAMLDSGAADKVGPKAPDRVQIRLAARKPKAKVAAAPAPKPKPKVAVVPVPKPKTAPPRLQPKPQQQPPRPRPVAVRPTGPIPKPVPRPEPPARRPHSAPRGRSTPPPAARREVASEGPAARAPRSTRRLSGSGRPEERRPTVPQSSPVDEGGRAGEAPLQPGSERLPVGERDQGGSAESSLPAGPGPSEPGPSQGEPEGPGPAGPGPSEPSPSRREPPPPPPKKDPPPRPEPPPPPKPKMREATIEVPTIKLPANLRRESLKASLQLRAVIGPDGSVDFKLSESSGNSEVDDYVLAQVRQVAVATPALDDNGQPKRTMKRVRVDIEVD